MPLTFNPLLVEAGLDPARVRLLRHGRDQHPITPYQLWQRDPALLERYQSTQADGPRSRARFRGSHWASFVVTLDGRTLFVGLFAIGAAGPVPAGLAHELSGGPLPPDDDLYELDRSPLLADYVRRLAIDWGSGARQRVQLAGNRNKPIEELSRRFVEPAFPGYLAFESDLDGLARLYDGWQALLAAAKGAYVFTCPQTREIYVGSATGEGGFPARWRDYAHNGHGGNVRLKRRDASNYRMGILQVAGTGDDDRAILAMEERWKRKLRSREMGLNAN